MAGFEVLDRAKQVNQGSSYPVNRPSHHYIECTALRLLEKVIESRSILAALSTLRFRHR
jgi:hypothetical protein